MRYDSSWRSLLRPGDAADFFRAAGRIGPFQPEKTEYSPVNAWWLSEICRLIYRRGKEESGILSDSVCRDDFLKRNGLKESAFFNENGLQYALVSNPSEDFFILVFRGTNRFEHWFSNLNTLQMPWSAGGQVHAGFKSGFDRIWPELSEILSAVSVPLFCTGHSLGGALATLAVSLMPSLMTYTFGSPRVGDRHFVNSLASTSVWRIALEKDIVATLPPSRPPFDFCHAGKPVFLRHDERCREKDYSRLPDKFSFSYFGKFTRPPDFLSAHAPLNYSACLARERDKMNRV